MNTIPDIIKAFGGPSAFARFFGVTRSTVNTWRRRNYFPPTYDLDLIREAKRRKINLDYEHLAKIRTHEKAV